MSIKSTVFISLLAVGVIISSNHVLKSHQNLLNYVRHNSPNKPDSLMFNVHYRDYSKTGALKSKLNAPKVTHLESHDTLVITKPRGVVYCDNGNEWTFSAKHGLSLHNETVYLTNHAILHKIETDSPVQTTVKSSKITLYPKKSFAESDQNVTITRAGSILKGKGMTADLRRNILTSLSHSRGIYAPTINNTDSSTDSSKHS